MPNLHNFIHTPSFCFYIFQGLVTKAEIRSPFPLVPASPPSCSQPSHLDGGGGKWQWWRLYLDTEPTSPAGPGYQLQQLITSHTLPLVTSLWGRIRLQATAGRGASAVVEDAGLVLHLRQGLRHQVDLHPHPQLHQEVGGRPEEASQGAGFRWEEKKFESFLSAETPTYCSARPGQGDCWRVEGRGPQQVQRPGRHLSRHYMIRAVTRYAI